MEYLIVFFVSSAICFTIFYIIVNTMSKNQTYDKITRDISFKEFSSMFEHSPEKFSFYNTYVVDNLTKICIQFNVIDTIRMNFCYMKYKRNCRDEKSKKYAEILKDSRKSS